MCEMPIHADESTMDLYLLCERCGDPTEEQPCGPCRDDEFTERYEPGYALLVEDFEELPW